MVVRVALLSLCLLACLAVAAISPQSVLAQQFYPPAPCGPAAWGPAPQTCGLPSPFGLCGGFLGGCCNICGVCLTIPGAIMRGLLAPPPPLPLPPFGVPGMGRPPAMPPCSMPAAPPCPRPAPVRKCKVTSACEPLQPAVACQPPRPVASGARQAEMVQSCTPLAPVVPGCCSLCLTLFEMPLRLSAGVLSTPLPYDVYPPYAEKSGKEKKSALAHYW